MIRLTRPRRQQAVVLLALAAAVGAACGQFSQGGGAAKSAAPPQSAGSPSASAQAVRHIPAQIKIPSIGVTATVEQVALDQNNNMDVPKQPMDAAWYSPGPAPGQSGDAVIDGHLDWYGMPQAIFFNLDKLQVGDEIDIIAQDGTTQRFRVSKMANYPWDAHPTGLFATSGEPKLSLITCAGSWDTGSSTYSQRLVVDSTLMSSGSGN